MSNCTRVQLVWNKIRDVKGEVGIGAWKAGTRDDVPEQTTFKGHYNEAGWQNSFQWHLQAQGWRFNFEVEGMNVV